jgi:hypothetical protein
MADLLSPNALAVLKDHVAFLTRHGLSGASHFAEILAHVEVQAAEIARLTVLLDDEDPLVVRLNEMTAERNALAEKVRELTDIERPRPTHDESKDAPSSEPEKL